MPARRSFRQRAAALVSATRNGQSRAAKTSQQGGCQYPPLPPQNPSSPLSMLAHKQPRWLYGDVLTDGATSWKFDTTFLIAGHIQSSIKF